MRNGMGRAIGIRMFADVRRAVKRGNAQCGMRMEMS